MVEYLPSKQGTRVRFPYAAQRVKMIIQLLTTGISGGLIIMYIIGLGLIFKTIRDRQDNNLSWKKTISNNITGAIKWILFIFSLLVTLIIIFGLAVSILDDMDII